MGSAPAHALLCSSLGIGPPPLGIGPPPLRASRHYALPAAAREPPREVCEARGVTRHAAPRCQDARAPTQGWRPSTVTNRAHRVCAVHTVSSVESSS